MKASLLLFLAPIVSTLPASADAHKAPMKGICLVTKPANWKARVLAVHPSWHYNWNASLPAGKADAIPGVEYVPMIFTGRYGDAKPAEKLAAMKDFGATTVLAYNEPDGDDQGDTTVAQALAQWPLFKKSGLRVGSPATTRTDAGDAWMAAFMKGLPAGEKPDFIAMHWYGDFLNKKGDVQVDGLESAIRKVHKRYGKPVWVTEFAAADWSQSRDKVTPAQALAFMKLALPLMDRLAAEGIVERYAWFSGLKPQLDQSSLFVDDSDKLTPLGAYYRDYKPQVAGVKKSPRP